MKRFVLFICVLISSSFVFGSEYVVNPDGSMDYTTIQAAIDDSGTVAGDVVIVVPGTYYENIDLSGKAITLRSTDPGDAAIVTSTIIDGNDLGTVISCVSGENSNTVIDGFVITNGTGTELFTGDYYGGGILADNASSPTITNCLVIGNSAKSGAGMFNYHSSNSVLSNSTFIGNTADTYGGGIYNNGSSPTITNCKFISNTAVKKGGGMYNSQSSPEVVNCKITSNSAEKGGGVYNNSCESIIITGCTLTGNSAIAGGDGQGGGMYNASSSPEVASCTFVGNTASYTGGGMYNGSSSPQVTGCTFSGNAASSSGGGMENFFSTGTIVTDSYLCFNAPDAISGTIHSNSGNNLEFCAPPKAAVEGDLTGDGKVDMADLAELAASWLEGVE